MWQRVLKTITAGLLALTVFTAPLYGQEVGAAEQAAVENVISDQISAFRETDFERAFSHAAPGIRDFFRSTDRFIAMVQTRYGPLFDPDFFTFGRKIFQRGEIYQEVFATDRNGKQWQAVYTLKQQEDGSWKITGVKMEPFIGSST